MIKSSDVVEALYNKIKEYTKQTGEVNPAVYISKETLFILKYDIALLETIVEYIKKWQDLLKIDGKNTKSMVLNDIQYLLKKVDS